MLVLMYVSKDFLSRNFSREALDSPLAAQIAVLVITANVLHSRLDSNISNAQIHWNVDIDVNIHQPKRKILLLRHDINIQSEY